MLWSCFYHFGNIIIMMFFYFGFFFIMILNFIMFGVLFMKLGEKIQALRRSAGMSQESLAQYLNVNRNCLSRVETCKVEPSISMVKEIAKLFNVDIETLIDTQVRSLNTEEKINIIYQHSQNLSDKDLDFIIKLMNLLEEGYVRGNTRS